jgi:hypothetical protein
VAERALTVAFAAIGIILLSPIEDQAYAGAQTFMLSISLATILAGTIEIACYRRCKASPAFASPSVSSWCRWAPLPPSPGRDRFSQPPPTCSSFLSSDQPIR